MKETEKLEMVVNKFAEAVLGFEKCVKLTVDMTVKQQALLLGLIKDIEINKLRQFVELIQGEPLRRLCAAIECPYCENYGVNIGMCILCRTGGERRAADVLDLKDNFMLNKKFWKEADKNESGTKG